MTFVRHDKLTIIRQPSVVQRTQARLRNETRLRNRGSLGDQPYHRPDLRARVRNPLFLSRRCKSTASRIAVSLYIAADVTTRRRAFANYPPNMSERNNTKIDAPNSDPASIAGCPVVSSRVHPRGWTSSAAETGLSASLPLEQLLASSGVQGVHPPAGTIAQGARVCAPTLRAMVAAKGWTPWTGLFCPSNNTASASVSAKSVSTPGGGHKWTGADSVSTRGWSAW